jgi:hypothetical protein
VNVVVTRAPVGQPVNEPWIAVESEDDRLVRGEQRIKILIVRMLARGLQLHQIHDIDDANVQLRRIPAKDVNSRQSLE